MQRAAQSNGPAARPRPKCHVRQVDALKMLCEDHLIKDIPVGSGSLKHALTYRLLRRRAQCIRLMVPDLRVSRAPVDDGRRWRLSPALHSVTMRASTSRRTDRTRTAFGTWH